MKSEEAVRRGLPFQRVACFAHEMWDVDNCERICALDDEKLTGRELP